MALATDDPEATTQEELPPAAKAQSRVPPRRAWSKAQAHAATSAPTQLTQAPWTTSSCPQVACVLIGSRFVRDEVRTCPYPREATPTTAASTSTLTPAPVSKATLLNLNPEPITVTRPMLRPKARLMPRPNAKPMPMPMPRPALAPTTAATPSPTPAPKRPRHEQHD
jgi:hypothetical protein